MTHERDCDQLTSGGMNGCVCGLIKKVRAEAQEPFRQAIKDAANGFGWARDGAYLRACDEVFRLAMRGEIDPATAKVITQAIDALRGNA